MGDSGEGVGRITRRNEKISLHRGVEQLVARRAHNPKVLGSSPSPATKIIPARRCLAGIILNSDQDRIDCKLRSSDVRRNDEVPT